MSIGQPSLEGLSQAKLLRAVDATVCAGWPSASDGKGDPDEEPSDTLADHPGTVPGPLRQASSATHCFIC